MSISQSTLITTVTQALDRQDQYNEKKYLPRAEATTVLRYRGTVETFEALPATGNAVGDVYNIQTYTTATDINGDIVHAGDNVAFVTLAGGASGWDALGGTISLTNYYTKAQVDEQIAAADENISEYQINAAVAAANPGIQLGTAADTPAGGGE